MNVTVVFCDKHAGEPYPPRCDACESLRREYAALPVVHRCDRHPAHLLPCEKCENQK